MRISRKLAVLLCVTLLVGLLGLEYPSPVQAQTWSGCPRNQSIVDTFAVLNLQEDCTLPANLIIRNNRNRNSVTIRGNGHTLKVNGGSRHFLVQNRGWLKLENVVLADASVTANGGSIYVQSGGILETFDGTVFSNNRTTGRSFPGQGFGGAIMNDGGSVTLNNTAMTGNSAHFAGGAVFNLNGGRLTVRRGSTFSNNSASSGGGIYSGGIDIGDLGGAADVVVIDSLFTGNSSSAIVNSNQDAGSKMYVINNTFVGNRGLGSAGAIAVDGHAGSEGPTIIRNNTFSGNSASGDGTAIRNDLGTVTVANNIMGSSGFDNCHDTAIPALMTLTNNRSVDGTCGGDVSAADLNLGPLQYNGGPTRTMALGMDSVAIDAGGATCTTYNGSRLTTDQRGVPRPAGACDLGAFEYSPHRLNVTVSGSGSVSSASPLINCGATCSALHDGAATLTAAPAVGYEVTWAGCDTTSGNTCTVDLSSSDRNVSATFSQIMVTVDINKSGPGTVTSAPAGIDCGADRAHDYAYGSTVTLTAAPDTGHHIVWGGCNTAVDNTCTVDVAAVNRTVTALFTPNPYTLSVHFGGDGTGSVTSDIAGIDCGLVCASVYGYGTTVTLTASPDAGYLFTGWMGADAVSAGCGSANTCTVLIDQARAVTAQFGLVAGPPVSCDALSIIDGWGIYAEGTTTANAYTIPDPPEGYTYAASTAYEGWCDVFTINSEHSPLPVTVCLPASDGVIGLYHDQPDLTRTWSILPTARRGDELCTELPALGSVALLTGGAPAQIAPADASGGAAAPAQVSVDCQVTTTHILRFRDAPGLDSDVLTRIPYQRTLNATAMSGNWYQVSYLGQTGWVSADYVTAECE